MKVYYSKKLDEIVLFGWKNMGCELSYSVRVRGVFSARKLIKKGPKAYGLIKIGQL